MGQTEKVNSYISLFKATMLSQILTHDLRWLAVDKVSSSLFFNQKDCRYIRVMALPVSNSGKKLIQIDVSSDTVCPWCFVGKRNMDKAIAASKDRFDFEVSLSFPLTVTHTQCLPV
uniref:DSBA-like thioredoxin domain-containing protein n=1 Tax=Rhizophora mucronata TaxID=61149 RepID=A0A2P2KSQ4_RHIMU